MSIYNNDNGIVKQVNGVYINNNQIINHINSKYQNDNNIIKQTYSTFRWVKLDTSKLLESTRGSGYELNGYIYPEKVYGLICTAFAEIRGTREYGFSTPEIRAINSNVVPSEASSIIDTYFYYSPASSYVTIVSTTENIDKTIDNPHYLSFGAYSSGSLQYLVSRSVTADEINIVTRYNAGAVVTTTMKISNIYVKVK